MDYLNNIKKYVGRSVTLIDNTKIEPVKQGLIQLSNKFSDKVRTATDLPKLQTSSLVAVGPLYGDNTMIIF